MTYCVAINVDEGLVMLSDTRTNAGVDNISRFRKMYTWEEPGVRAIALMTAGNLSITQGVLSRIQSAMDRYVLGDDIETIMSCDTMYRAAEIVGAAMRDMMDSHGESISQSGASAGAAIILTGQRKGGRPRIFLIYSAGNFIEATRDTPFLQIGEHKYGKPILDRVIDSNTSLNEAVKAAVVSMDSTMHSNLSVGMPLDLAVLPRDTFQFRTRRRIERGDDQFDAISAAWSESLRHSFAALPDFAD
ncbi:MAG: peptidase [Sphingopyxis sp.]